MSRSLSNRHIVSSSTVKDLVLGPLLKGVRAVGFDMHQTFSVTGPVEAGPRGASPPLTLVSQSPYEYRHQVSSSTMKYSLHGPLLEANPAVGDRMRDA